MLLKAKIAQIALAFLGVTVTVTLSLSGLRTPPPAPPDGECHDEMLRMQARCPRADQQMTGTREDEWSWWHSKDPFMMCTCRKDALREVRELKLQLERQKEATEAAMATAELCKAERERAQGRTP